MIKTIKAAVAALLLIPALLSCTKDQPVQPAHTLNCQQPAFLKAGDKVALIYPSYFTPMENVTKTADVLQGTMSSFLATGGTDISSTLVRDLLKGQVPRYELPAHPQNITGSASGTLVE